MRDLVIIGAGPAGYTAAIYAARAGLAPLVFEGEQVGGQLMTTTEIENFPGFPRGIQGPELMAGMRDQAARFGAELVMAAVTEIDLTASPIRLKAGERVEEARSVIIATGATAKRLGLDSERALYGKGVSACATCDGFFFKGKRVLVVGGGDSALEEANYLTRFADSVTVIVRRDKLRASLAMQEKAKANPKLSFTWNAEVAEILGVEVGHVTGVKLRDTVTGETTEVGCDGVFAAIGHEPNTAVFGGKLELDQAGYIVTHAGTETSLPGVFACGDVQDHRYRQAITAAGTGCMAALDAQRYLEEHPAA
jgi:thioredoxin reductase (NADPH)